MKRILTAVTLTLLFATVPVLSDETRQICLPSAAWAVEMPDPGFKINPIRSHFSKEAMNLEAEHNLSAMQLSASIGPTTGEGSGKELRAAFIENLKDSSIKTGELITYERGPLAILDFTVEEFKGQELSGRNVFIFLTHQGSGVAIHLSKQGLEEGDKQLFDTILEGIRLVERKQSDLTSVEFVLVGEEAAARGDCDEASANFQVALAINKVKAQMTQHEWIGTQENLAICYGKSGEHEKAKSILLSAIAQDAKYPNLHYNLACAYAELGEDAEAVAALTTAFEKMKSSPYDKIPNPLEDASFDSIKENKEFKAIGKKIRKAVR